MENKALSEFKNRRNNAKANDNVICYDCKKVVVLCR